MVLEETEETFQQERPLNPEAILDTLSDGVFCIDGQGKILAANKAGEELFTGKTAAELVGQDFTGLLKVGEKDLERIKQILSTPEGEEPAALEVKDESQVEERYWELVVNKVTGGDQRVVSLRDVTERRAANIKRGISLVATTACHEINNPLSVVIGFGQLMLAREDLTPESRDTLENKILPTAQRIARVTKKLMEAERLPVTVYQGDTMMLDIHAGEEKETGK